jgi:hypothetical protein
LTGEKSSPDPATGRWIRHGYLASYDGARFTNLDLFDVATTSGVHALRDNLVYFGSLRRLCTVPLRWKRGEEISASSRVSCPNSRNITSAGLRWRALPEVNVRLIVTRSASNMALFFNSKLYISSSRTRAHGRSGYPLFRTSAVSLAVGCGRVRRETYIPVRTKAFSASKPDHGWRFMNPLGLPSQVFGEFRTGISGHPGSAPFITSPKAEMVSRTSRFRSRPHRKAYVTWLRGWTNGREAFVIGQPWIESDMGIIAHGK